MILTAKKTQGKADLDEKRALANRSRAGKWRLRWAGGGTQVLSAPELDRLKWLVHGFSTRSGGASELAEPGSKRTTRVLNLGFTDWDARERVLGNRRRFFRGVNAGGMAAVTLRQFHSDVVHLVDRAETAQAKKSAPGDAPKADALITREPGMLLIVQTADCIPILLADTKNRAVAAIHSGWRGTLGAIAEKALGRMRMEFGTKPADVIAALGPGIGRCCYEVGSEVAKEFHSQFPDAREWFDGPFDALAAGDNDPNWLPWLTMRPPGHPPPPPRVQLDLIAANRSILMRAGIAPKRIFWSGFCTACRSDLFFSYRRERVTGRMMAAIGIREN